MSGMNALKIDWNNVKELEQKKKLPIFLYHGENDEMISQKISGMSYKEFHEQGFKNI